MSKNYSVKEAFTGIAGVIKEQIAAHEKTIVALRKKELEREHGKLNKSQLCPLCAGPELKCGCTLAKAEKLNKKTPPDISEKTMHKLKDEYGHDEKGKEKAYATAWSIENKMKKDEMSTSYAARARVSHGDKGKIKADYGDGPHDQRPGMVQATGGVNGYESGNGRTSLSLPKVSPNKGPMRKDEIGGEPSSMMMSEMCKSCGKPNDLCKCMGKGEITPDAGKASIPKGKPSPGNGGEIKKVSLKKNLIPSGKPQVQGVAGKQPVGMGGGDAGGAKVPGLASAKGLSSTASWKQQGLPQLRSDLSAVKGGAGWLKSTHASAARIRSAKAAPASQRFHGAMPLQRKEDEANKKTEVAPADEGLSAMNHSRNILKVK